MEIIKFKGVKKQYHSRTEAIKGVDFSVRKREIIGIIYLTPFLLRKEKIIIPSKKQRGLLILFT
ncbi:hypothetical protein [Marinitoga aeolica]|uniref:Uncharacterized protein n=1 Tax=Marinitoga aeolica TaxID=2809031 RepID=A0ABY8PPM6_9BACT|nr:hypothetical protein [Marinitoga aeolica]WGS64570.1 hypothetical protein JRV97_09360 [Marinitoga aeolica]